MAKISEEFDIDFVAISHNQCYFKSKFLKCLINFAEVVHQHFPIQIDHWDEADEIFVVASERRSKKRQKCSCGCSIFIAKKLPPNVFNPFSSENLKMQY